MSDWNPSLLKPHFQHYKKEIYRLVEAQHIIATRKFVDSDEEQEMIENLLEASKPPVETKNSRGVLHQLLYTPFRYPPLREGARFHTFTERSIFYASEDVQTAMAEIAHRRFKFMRDTKAKLVPYSIPYMHFVAEVNSKRAVLLTHPPFKSLRAKISHPTSYAYAQSLGKALRAAGAVLFDYYSARRTQGINVGLFSTEAFAKNKPVQGKTKNWNVFEDNNKIEFKGSDVLGKKETFTFVREDVA
jgi:hypothetical protein